MLALNTSLLYLSVGYNTFSPSVNRCALNISLFSSVGRAEREAVEKNISALRQKRASLMSIGEIGMMWPVEKLFKASSE